MWGNNLRYDTNGPVTEKEMERMKNFVLYRPYQKGENIVNTMGENILKIYLILD